jgi:hypothetical protein
MSTSLPSLQQADLEKLLSDLAGRVDGVIDFWTLVCLLRDDQMARRKDLLTEHSARMQAQIDAIRMNLGEAGIAADETAPYLKTMTSACQELLTAVLVLMDFRTRPLVEVEQAVVALAGSRASLHDAIRGLARAFGLEVAYWKKRSAEYHSSIQRILDGLFETFRLALASEQQALPHA